jgi:chorismate dehydratase
MERLTPLKIGRISYLNTLPLFYAMMQSAPDSFQLISGVPSEINHAFLEGQVDLAFISTFSYLKNKNKCDLIKNFCLGSDGAVDSVCLLSTRPIETLNHARIGLTKASATSQSILKILLQHYFQFQIHAQEIDFALVRGSWQENFDAILVIGDDALSLAKNSAPYWYDLGNLWKQKTDASILFAVLVKQKSVSEKSAQTVNTWLEKSLRSFKENPNPVIAFAQSQSSLKINFQEYFSKLQFVFTEESHHALSVYEAHLKAMKLL